MNDAETVALARAVALLVLVSLVRWGSSTWREDPSPEPDRVLPELLAESRGAAAESERRSEPLAAGERIDLNRADEVSLDRLPGIGPATARAIVAARDEGAVFRTPTDVLAVPGVGEVTLSRIRPHLTLSDPPRRAPATGRGDRGPVDVNRADADGLASLPGIGPALAARIVAERRERMFTSLADLERVRGIGPATVERLRPHAVAGPGR